MGIIPDDFVLMPTNEDEEYVNHVYLIVILWTALVIGAGITLAVVTL